jgi:exonuclease SbcC
MVGFTSFREPVTVDFAEADLFALVGPTGSGKSSIIDAICFALYGSVPRLENVRLVAPVISTGLAEARVRCVFTVGDRTFDAVRVVRRTAAGATTKEARLQERFTDGSETVVAGNAAEVSESVERLVGLNFAQFTKAVVLPQGKFAAFLHAEPSERQTMLENLLNLREVEELARRANSRAQTVEGELAALERRRSELGERDEATIAALDIRIGALVALSEQVREVDAQLTELNGSATLLDQQLAKLTDQTERLRVLRAPANLDATLAERAASTERVNRCEVDLTAVSTARAHAEDALGDDAATTEIAALEAVRAQHQELATLRERISKGEHVVEDLRTKCEQSARQLEVLNSVRTESLAALLAAEWHNGDPCPVCGTAVESLPNHVGADAQRASAERDAARLANEELRVKRGSAEARLSDLHEQADTLAQSLASAPSIETIDAAARRRRDLEATVMTARDGERSARSAVQSARAALDAQAAAMETFRKGFREAERRVIDLDPPSFEVDALQQAWADLTAWSVERSKELAERHARTTEQILSLQQARDGLLSVLISTAQQLGLSGTDTRSIGKSVADAQVIATVEREREADAQREREQLDAQLPPLRTEHAVAKELGQALGAKRFRRWLLDDALSRLEADATARLLELSAGAYSLVRNEKSGEFAVIDHFAADETRSARTLSGGETFLVSLALALALSDQVSEAAGGSATALDALFVDEGFGTLDSTTLEVIATALEELGSHGRMVGVVTHVTELAERLPVQFVVSKANSSTVERIDT